jgi:hypothetical protein
VAQRVHVRRFRRPAGQTLLGEERWEERQRGMVIAKGRAIPEYIMDVPVLLFGLAVLAMTGTRR